MPAGAPAKWLREPLLHFLAAGLVLFVAGKALRTQDDAAVIVITPQREAQLASRYSTQFGVTPDATTLAQLVEQDIDEEILFRRGLELGLAQGDEIVRRRVVQKMQFLLQDVSAPSEPDEPQLMTYFATHAARYAAAPRVTFTHVYFSTQDGEATARQRASDALAHMARGANAADLGDPFPDLYHFAAYEPEQIHRLFGRGDFAAAAFSAPLQRWDGPYQSALGWHLIHVGARRAAWQPAFAEVRERVRADYLLEEQARMNVAAFSNLADEYKIVRTKS